MKRLGWLIILMIGLTLLATLLVKTVKFGHYVSARELTEEVKEQIESAGQ